MNKLERNRLKVAIAEAGLDLDVAKACRSSFADYDSTHIEALRDAFGNEVVNVAEYMNRARRKRRQRVSSRIEDYVRIGECQFLTLTFKDEVFAKTSAETRRRYVARFLKANCGAYVANIDFGNAGKEKTYIDADGVFHQSTAREHYHAVVFGNRINFKAWHKYGAIKTEKVKTSSDDVTKVSKYVAKLSSHALKVNLGKAPRLIFSRDKQAIASLFADLF